MAIALVGCRGATETTLWRQIDQLSKENTDLKVQLQQVQKENLALSAQVHQLAGLSPEQRLEALPTVQTIKINQHSGIFDKDQDGQPETVVAHLELWDSHGDSIKAAGGVRLELWDINAEPQHARLAAWDIRPKALNALWGRGLMSNYYRIAFPLPQPTRPEGRFILKVQFTDYLTGKIHQTEATLSVKK